MDQIEFYNVKTRQKVSVPVSSCKKVKYENTTKNGSIQVRYAVRAEMDGARLTKFVSKDTWDSLSCPEE